ncbi:unnamed protein product [Ceratitis capitata]|uniref:(Mediterranean fruit fly) hypothetical protein n=1 Tax=Ceratitis capitata TaxID=7213 RepID=A0A811U508_CERCA|nr:unnamed protein product [Ceratitis capitata]
MFMHSTCIILTVSSTYTYLHADLQVYMVRYPCKRNAGKLQKKQLQYIYKIDIQVFKLHSSSPCQYSFLLYPLFQLHQYSNNSVPLLAQPINNFFSTKKICCLPVFP